MQWWKGNVGVHTQGLSSNFTAVTHPIREQPTAPFTVKAPPSLIRDLNSASQKVGSTRSGLIRTFLERGLEAVKKERG